MIRMMSARSTEFPLKRLAVRSCFPPTVFVILTNQKCQSYQLCGSRRAGGCAEHHILANVITQAQDVFGNVLLSIICNRSMSAGQRPRGDSRTGCSEKTALQRPPRPFLQKPLYSGIYICHALSLAPAVWWFWWLLVIASSQKWQLRCVKCRCRTAIDCRRMRHCGSRGENGGIASLARSPHPA